MKQDDALWKSLLEDVFDDFLLFFFKEQAAAFDLDKGFEFLDKELEQVFPVDADANQRFVDKLVKVFTKTGEEEWILVRVEVQGYNDPDFAKRMFTYYYRILDRYNRQITSIAIFTDPIKSFKPSEYRRSFMGAEVIFRYNVYKIIEQDREELLQSSNPFAIIILTVLTALQKGKADEDEIVDLKLELARALMRHGIPKSKVSTIMNFLRYYLRLEKPENVAKFETQLNILTNKNGANMGIEEFLLQRERKEGEETGMEKGIEKTKTDIVESLIINSDLSDERISRIVGVTVEFVRKMRASLK